MSVHGICYYSMKLKRLGWFSFLILVQTPGFNKVYPCSTETTILSIQYFYRFLLDIKLFVTDYSYIISTGAREICIGGWSCRKGAEQYKNCVCIWKAGLRNTAVSGSLKLSWYCVHFTSDSATFSLIQIPAVWSMVFVIFIIIILRYFHIL